MQFHILSFEGPDAYAWAGGIATRVEGLARALADLGLETYLWFVGDPEQALARRRRYRRGHEEPRMASPPGGARGVEAHAAEVLAAARGRGLRVAERAQTAPDISGLLAALADVRDLDVVSLRSPVAPCCRLLPRLEALPARALPDPLQP